jgi:hypothetical protein
MYLGVLFYKTSSDGGGDDIFWQCSTFPIGNIISPTSSVPREQQLKALRISINSSEFATKITSIQGNVWKTRAFLCSKALGWCEQLYGYENPLGYLIPCDDDPAETSFVTTGTVELTDFKAIRLNGGVRVTVTLTNYTGASRQIGTTSNKPYVEISIGGSSPDSHSFDPVTIGNNESYSFEYRFFPALEAIDTARFHAIYTIGSSTYTIDESHPVNNKDYHD